MQNGPLGDLNQGEKVEHCLFKKSLMIKLQVYNFVLNRFINKTSSLENLGTL